MSQIHKQMIINYVPDEDCRIAVLESGRLEEFYSERKSENLHVGNIYLGRVTNVEPGIQAAFVDFGVETNGFLHVTDVHPKYFPGNPPGTTEPIGRKTPHRQRPPIQQCLRRGQEVMVQVLKEGIGTKGPTLTTYLSIPGRYLVMLPDMSDVGVSRKVEDLEVRREMRKTLEGIEFPEGLGFILRTAGIGKTKTDLRRDLAYLQRLWKAIQKKRGSSRAPAELYAESDLLLRTIRDVLTADVEEIVIDDADAVQRVDEFLSIVTPRSRTAKLIHYDKPMPIFHAYGVEEQIDLMHARTVPLPSGGSLVIDQAEALVAIDVNSGRMRHHGDAETTALKTNLEAVDEITRQLRLRDLGGLVVMDLIDMRSRSHQRQVENRLRDNLKRDRAKAEFQHISRYGIIEMTRQRMRPSLRKTSFAECPTCHGRGHIKTAELTASEALRTLAFYIQFPKVAKVELVVSDAVAGALLSRQRRRLNRIEEQAGKPVEIRVSKAIAPDRVDFYAYDEDGADVELRALTVETLKSQQRRQAAQAAAARSGSVEAKVERVEEAATGANGAGRRKRRRRRRKGGGEAKPDAVESTVALADDETAADQFADDRERVGDEDDGHDGEQVEPAASESQPMTNGEGGGRRRRRRRRRGRRGREATDATASPPGDDATVEFADESLVELPTEPAVSGEAAETAPQSTNESAQVADEAIEEGEVEQRQAEPTKRRRRGKRSAKAATVGGDDVEPAPTPEPTARSIAAQSDAAEEPSDAAPAKKTRRRRSRQPAASEAAAVEAGPVPKPVETGKVVPARRSGKAAGQAEPAAVAATAADDAGDGPKAKKPSRRGGRKKTSKASKTAEANVSPTVSTSGERKRSETVTEPKPIAPAAVVDESPKQEKPRRSLYAGTRRRLKPGQIPTSGGGDDE